MLRPSCFLLLAGHVFLVPGFWQSTANKRPSRVSYLWSEASTMRNDPPLLKGRWDAFLFFFLMVMRNLFLGRIVITVAVLHNLPMLLN